jgi:HEAT repeat protein
MRMYQGDERLWKVSAIPIQLLGGHGPFRAKSGCQHPGQLCSRPASPGPGPRPCRGARWPSGPCDRPPGRPRANPPQPDSFEPEDVSILIVALASRDQAVRCVAASDLGEFGPAAISAVPALIETLRVSLHLPVEAGTAAWPDWVPRDAAEVAARALGRVAPAAPSMEAISALREALRSSRAAPREAAALALGGFGATAAVALPDLIKALRETIATEKPYSDSAINLGQSQFPVFTGYRIAEAIARIGADTDSSEAAAVLAEALSAKSERTREGAINSLRSLAPRSASARARLTEALRHSDREVRAAAESILAELKPTSDR